MRYATPKTDGNERRLDKKIAPVVLAALLLSSIVLAQALYKYTDANGVWVYTDRKPDDRQIVDGQTVEVSELSLGVEAPEVTVTSNLVGRTVQIDAHNKFAVPVEVILFVDNLKNLRYPDANTPLRWTIDAQSRSTLLELNALNESDPPEVEIRYTWIVGDPKSVHQPSEPYRAPFAVATDYPITQSFPDSITHLTPDSQYAVDLAMPIGTDIYAARGGVVFEVASTNFRGGTDPDRDASAANIVRIMHDDGSHAIYAHLNWNSIRVRPGDRVARGEYIADSGNTGFLTGPHLHFVVLLNRGARLTSVPVVFEGPNSLPIGPQTGRRLVAY